MRDALDGAFKAHYLERTLDSKPWPCDYGDAQWIKVRVPKEVVPPPTPALPPFPEPPISSAFVAEAELSSSQIQDLAEAMGEILNAAAGGEMKFNLRVELKKTASKELLAKLNNLLKEVNPKLKLA